MRYLILASLIIFAKVAQAKTLLISDIDDTIKISNVKNKLAHAANAFSNSNVFFGIADLYQLIQQKGLDVEVAYVTNAASSVTKRTHQELIEKNGFPPGEIFFRDDKKDHEHKVRTIRKLIEEKQPSILILIGDNGEKDILYYDQIASENSISVIQFIRLLYKSGKKEVLEIKPGQLPFITPLEIGFELVRGGVLQLGDFEAFSDQLNASLQTIKGTPKFESFVPSWADCRDFKFENPTVGSHQKAIELAQAQCARRK